MARDRDLVTRVRVTLRPELYPVGAVAPRVVSVQLTGYRRAVTFALASPEPVELDVTDEDLEALRARPWLAVEPTARRRRRRLPPIVCPPLDPREEAEVRGVFRSIFGPPRMGPKKGK